MFSKPNFWLRFFFLQFSLRLIVQIASFEFEPDARVKLRMDQQRGLSCECGLNGFQKWLKATELFINPTSIKCQVQTGRSNAQLERLVDAPPSPM